MAKIGFTTWQDIESPVYTPGPVAFTFDSGRKIPLADCRTNVLVTGTVGSGKTASVGKPICNAAIEAGCPVVNMDPKRNFGESFRGMAKAAGREKDVMELGNLPSAKAINIISGMSDTEMYDFFYSLVRKSFEGKTGNMDFHIHGVTIAVDCAWLLNQFHKIDPSFEANLVSVNDILHNYKLGADLFKVYKEKYYDPNDVDAARHVSRIESDNFHPLIQNERTRDNSTQRQQINYALHGIRQALDALLAAPGMAEKFAAHGAPGLDMANWIKNKALITVRFSLDAGSAAGLICKALTVAAYRAVYEVGLSMDKLILIMIDEFQDSSDMSSDKYSDRSFVSQCREFNAMCVYITQSVSALVKNRDDGVGVENFTSNINQWIMFFTTDGVTNGLVKSVAPKEDLTCLKDQPGHVFVKTFSITSRKHEWGFDSVNDAYARACGIVAIPAAPVEQSEAEVSLYQLVKDRLPQLRKQNRMLNGMQKEENMNVAINKYARDLETRYPDIVRITEKSVFIVPVGWRPALEKFLDFYRSVELGMVITGASMKKSGFSVQAIDPTNEQIDLSEIFGDTLRDIGRHCLYCGKPLGRRFAHSEVLICQDCGKKLLSTETEPEKDDDDDDDTDLEGCPF